MRLVHHDGEGFDRFGGVQKCRICEPFGRDEDDAVLKRGKVLQNKGDLRRREGGIDIRSRDVRFGKGADLILHERDERRDDERLAVGKDGGEFVAQAFAAAGGHDPEGVAAGKDGVDERFLAVAEGLVAEDLLQNLALSVRGRLLRAFGAPGGFPVTDVDVAHVIPPVLFFRLPLYARGEQKSSKRRKKTRGKAKKAGKRAGLSGRGGKIIFRRRRRYRRGGRGWRGAGGRPFRTCRSGCSRRLCRGRRR